MPMKFTIMNRNSKIPAIIAAATLWKVLFVIKNPITVPRGPATAVPIVLPATLPPPAVAIEEAA